MLGKWVQGITEVNGTTPLPKEQEDSDLPFLGQHSAWWQIYVNPPEMAITNGDRATRAEKNLWVHRCWSFVYHTVRVDGREMVR